MFSEILVAWDASSNAHRAFEYALEIAQHFKARVHIVSVARAADHAETETERKASFEDGKRFYEERSGSLLQEAQRKAVDARLTVVEGGNPAAAILDTAHHIGADLIVVGRRGLSGITRFFMGSISDRIARYAKCPVLIIDER